MGAGDVEGDGGDAVADEFVEEVDAVEAGVAEGEVEAVADVLAHVLVVDDVEAVVGEEFLHDAGLLAVFPDVLDEVEGAVVGALEHGGHGVLHAVGSTAGEAVEGAEDEGAAELRLAVVAGQVGALHVEQLGRADHHGDTLTGIAEALGAADHQHIAVGIFGHGGLEGSLAGDGVVLAEVHEEVGVVLEDHHAVLVGHLADDLQLVVGEAEPGGIVGAAVDEAGHVAVLQLLFELVAQLVATVLIHVEGLHGDAEDAALLLLHGEAGVDEEHLGLLGIVAGEREEAGEACLHRAHGGHAAVGRDVDVEEVLDEAGGLFLEVGGTVDFGIDAGDAALQGLDLGLDTHLRCGQAGDAHLHLHEADTGLLLHILYHLAHLADAGLAGVLDLVGRGNAVYRFFLYRYL